MSSMLTTPTSFPVAPECLCFKPFLTCVPIGTYRSVYQWYMCTDCHTSTYTYTCTMVPWYHGTMVCHMVHVYHWYQGPTILPNKFCASSYRYGHNLHYHKGPQPVRCRPSTHSTLVGADPELPRGMAIAMENIHYGSQLWQYGIATVEY